MSSGVGEEVATGAPAPQEVVSRLLALDDEPSRRQLLDVCLAAPQLDGVEALLSLLYAEASRLWSIAPQGSLRLAEALLYAARRAGRPDHHAIGMMTRGDSLRYLGRYPEALAALDAAAQEFTALADQVGWARTRIGWLHASHVLGRAAQALEVVPEAQRILTAHQEWLRAAGLSINAAYVCHELGRYEQARRLYDQALHFYEQAGRADPSQRATAEMRAAKARANQAMLLTLLGDFSSALALHQEARQIFARHGEQAAVFRVDHYIANVYAGQGHYSRALALSTETLEALERGGFDTDAASVALDMVASYLGLNRNAEAAELARETVERFERGGALTEAAKARFWASLAEARRGRHAAALALLEEAAATFASAGLDTLVALAALQRATLHAAAADWAAAGSEAERAHALFTRLGLPVRRAQADVIRARARLALGDHQAATALAHAALAITEQLGLQWLAHEGHHVLAGVARTTGDAAGAVREYDLALAAIERVQSRQATELRANFLDDKLHVYHHAIEHSLALGRVQAAFAYLERAKSRALVDYLAATPDVRLRARDRAGQQLLDELAHLRQEHNWFYGQLYGNGLSPASAPETQEADTTLLQASIRDRERRIARILERLALRAAGPLDGPPEGSGVPLAAEHTTPPAVDERTLLLEYYLGAGEGEGGAIFVVTQDGLTVVPLAVRPRELQRLLMQWQLNLDATAGALAHRRPLEGLGHNARSILQALYRSLIAPVAGHLAGRERLIVVPYGLCHAVPFHALHDGAHYLVERLEVSVCPSSSLLRLCAGRARPERWSTLVVAHSAGALTHVLEEARAVAGLLPGEVYLEEDATRAAVIAAVPRHNVIHLAAHAEARLDNPEFAHLRLADGQLTGADVFNLELGGALVTLSACETGRAVVTGGDELIGLSRGFLFAGASTLVQSLWRVDDASTAELMTHFYRQLRQGRSRGAALRGAQRALLDVHGAHPYLWAPFQLVGDGDSGALAAAA